METRCRGTPLGGSLKEEEAIYRVSPKKYIHTLNNYSNGLNLKRKTSIELLKCVHIVLLRSLFLAF